jgi:kynurenine formamidase
MSQIVDLSIFLENDVISDPPPFRPRIEYIDHKTSMPGMLSFFPGLKAEDLPDGEAWSFEKIELITHNGTHLDAPYHFASTMNQGERAITIDEVLSTGRQIGFSALARRPCRERTRSGARTQTHRS